MAKKMCNAVIKKNHIWIINIFTILIIKVLLLNIVKF